jgi:hypothetical protein
MRNNDTPTPIIKHQLPYRLRADSWWLIDDDGTERQKTARYSAFNLILGGLKEKPIDRDSLHSKRAKIAMVRQV